MSNVIQLDGKSGDISERRFGIVVSSYHKNITGKLLDGAIATLAQHDVPEKNIYVIWVPGAFEIPLAAQNLIDADLVDAIVTLGCVIRGQTTHDQHINSSISNSIGLLALDGGLPVAFGVLTCNTTEQAIERSGGTVGNKGEEATLAAIQMLRLGDQIQSHSS